MKRILGIFAASTLLLTACGGGGLQSPSFTPVLAGIFIASQAESTPTTGTLLVVPGGTLQLAARGLYSTPPGTVASATNVACPTTERPDSLCTLGDVSGVTFSIDPQANSSQPLASVNSVGLVSGLRRGQATVRARLAGFTDASRSLIVNGPVLASIAVAVRDVKNNADLPRAGETVPSVPVGRVMQLTGTATCSTGGNGTGLPLQTGPQICTNQNYNFNWSLPAATPADTVTFIPSSAVGETIAVKTQRFGPFRVEVRFTNEEGDLKDAFEDLLATARVLDDIIVQADPVQAEPISIIKGTRVRFVAKGLFSDGSTDDVVEADLSAARPNPAPTNTRSGRRFTWKQDASFVGGPVVIEQPGDTNGNGTIDAGEPDLFNNSVIVSVQETANSPAVVGSNGLMATAFNIEPATLQVDDRAAIRIDDLGLTAITRICLASDLGSACTINTQLQAGGDPVKYVARGTFQGDAVGTERNIDPRTIPIQFSASTTSSTLIQVNVDGDRDGQDGDPTTGTNTAIDFDDVGSVRGINQGLARLIATLPNGFATTISDRDEAIDIAVVERQCRDQLLTGNGTVASAENGELVGISEVSDEGNVIDGIPNTTGVFFVGPSLLLGTTLSMDFRRDATPLLAAGGTQNVGFVLRDLDGYVASGNTRIITLNATGGEVETLESISPSAVQTVDGAGVLIQAQASQAFSGVRLELDIPMLLGIPGTLPTAILSGYEVRVYSACADVVPLVGTSP